MPSLITKPYNARGICRTERLPIAASQTFKQGDFVMVNSSGQVQQAITSGNGSSTNGAPTAWSSGNTNLWVGRANEDAQPQSGDITAIPNPKLYASVTICEPGTQFLVPIYHATAASAYPNPNLIGNSYELWNLSTPAVLGTGVSWPGNVYSVRIDKTTNVGVVIVDFDPTNYASWPDIGQTAAPSTGTFSQYAYAWVEFLGGTCLLSGARPITRSN